MQFDREESTGYGIVRGIWSLQHLLQSLHLSEMTWNLNWEVAFCVHNIAYQGRFAFADFDRLGLPDEFRSSFDFIDG